MVNAYAMSYYDDVKDKVIALSKDDKMLVIPYITRFDERYRKRVKAKFLRLIKKLKQDKQGRDTFLTLTFNPAKAMTLSQMREVFSDGVSRFIDRVKKKYGFTAYIKVFEITKSGLIHSHILFLNIPYIDPEWLNKQLKLLGLGEVFKIKEWRGDKERAIKYFMKYLTKSLEDNLFLAYTWVMNLRTYSWSYILNVILSRRKTNFESLGSGWVYYGVYVWHYDEYGVIDRSEFMSMTGVY